VSHHVADHEPGDVGRKGHDLEKVAAERQGRLVAVREPQAQAPGQEGGQ